VWNSYRKSRLIYLDRVIQFEEHFRQDARRLDVHPLELPRYLPKETPLEPLYSDVQDLATDIASSVPFHLTNFGSPWELNSMTPGRSVGGLLLLHPLFVASMRSAVSPDLRAYFRRVLAWIAEHMGIGQAAIFAKVRPHLGRHPYYLLTLSQGPGELPLEFVRDGHVLVWAGMLIRQT
jgi:hypothetical protein